MKVEDVQNLIDNKLQPNVAEWTMNVEAVLSETDNLTDRLSGLLNSIPKKNTSWHNSFPEESDTIVAVLKQVIKKMKKSLK